MTTRVSDLFGLGIGQAGLDFVDVDVVGDVPAHIDPFTIRSQDGWWFEACVGFLQSYFASLLEAIGDDDKARIRELIAPTSEPNETHLGHSKGIAAGSGLSAGKKAQALVDKLASSRAVTSGLLTDLEDTAFLVDGVGPDTLSDVTTSVIRQPLLYYTEQQCELHEIPMASFPSGPIWNPDTRNWEDKMVDLPETPGGKLLLIPKSIVRVRPALNTGEYYRKYLRPELIDDEARNPTSSLVKTIRGKTQPVSMKTFDAAMGTSKTAVVRHTEKHPTALKRYKEQQAKKPQAGFTQDELSKLAPVPDIDYIRAYEAIEAIAPGNAGATSFHREVAKLLSAVFEEHLANQRFEYELHEGRKRVDITMDNYARSGFFWWLAQHYRCPIMYIECKNYSKDPANQEIDQLSGRFSPSRGQVGMLVCRELIDREKLQERCKDTAKDGRGYILVLDDSDLRKLAEEAEELKKTNTARRLMDPKAHLLSMQFKSLDDQFRALIS